jgi:hypothetical protein
MQGAQQTAQRFHPMALSSNLLQVAYRLPRLSVSFRAAARARPAVDADDQQLPARTDPVVRYRTDNSFVIVYKLNGIGRLRSAGSGG